MSISEDQLTTWAKPPSETEEDKCRNAVDRITSAIRGKFGDRVSIFLQGSYKNRTNVRKDSDVDIVVRHDGYFFHDIDGLSPEDKQIYEAGRSPSNYYFSQYKNDIQSLLEVEFDYGEVERKNKCIRVNGNSYRVNADVVPCYQHKRFATPTRVSAIGIGLYSDSGDYTHSFPEQHYDSGVQKNKDTDGSYKDVVRIVKNARNAMVDVGIVTTDSIPSFLLESVVWNIHEIHFKHSTYREMTSAVIAKIWRDMRDSEQHKKYAEVSDLKWLFMGNKKWNPQQVESFINSAWSYFGF